MHFSDLVAAFPDSGSRDRARRFRGSPAVMLSASSEHADMQTANGDRISGSKWTELRKIGENGQPNVVAEVESSSRLDELVLSNENVTEPMEEEDEAIWRGCPLSVRRSLAEVNAGQDVLLARDFQIAVSKNSTSIGDVRCATSRS